MATAMSRLETAVSNIDQAGFFIGYAVSEVDASKVVYAVDEDENGMMNETEYKRARLDTDSVTSTPVLTGGIAASQVSAGIPSISSSTLHGSNGGSPALSQNLDDLNIPSLSDPAPPTPLDKIPDLCEPAPKTSSQSDDHNLQPALDDNANHTESVEADAKPDQMIIKMEVDDTGAVNVKTEVSEVESETNVAHSELEQVQAAVDQFENTIEADHVESKLEIHDVERQAEVVGLDLAPAPPSLLTSRRDKEQYDAEDMVRLHQSLNSLRASDQFSCGGRFILNDTDRAARVRFDCGEKELKDAGGICQLAVADLLRGHTKPALINPSQERGDHIAQDLAGDFRLSIHASANTKQPDDAVFLDEIRQRCCDVFNIPSLSLRRRHLRIYSKGGYSRMSMATPRVPQKTIATVVVCLPSPFTGGKLVVSHLKIRKSFSFSERSSSRDSVQWAAFYSDCEYEIKKVRSGHQALIIYDACVEGDEPMHRRQIYKQVMSRSIPTVPVHEISDLIDSVSTFLEKAPVLGLFTWYSYTLSALNKAPHTLKGLDRHIYDALSSRFRLVLLPVVVRLPYEDDASRNIRIAAFTRDDIEYMEGVADKPPHDDLEPFSGVIPFPLRSDIETFEFCSNDEVETTYFYSAMVILPNIIPIAEA